MIVQRLTDYIWTGVHSTLNDNHYNRVARIMNSLKRGVEELRSYYIGLDPIPLRSGDIHPRFFPSIHAYRDDQARIVAFKYTRPLENDPTCVTFCATTLEDSPKAIVVKFVQRYGADAHRCLAEKGFAPRLLYHGPVGVQDGDPTYGHLRMVVMEYIEGVTLDKAKELGQVPKTLQAQVTTALRHLHDDGFVFGDLRPPNIMITMNEKIKLIDFDWAGKKGISQYPLLISPRLNWPDGVGGLSIMETRHDMEMVTQL